jgi:hypothetical protein
MGLDALKAQMPDYARDTKLNLGTVLGTSPLSEQQLWGTALACAMAARNPVVLREIAAPVVVSAWNPTRRPSWVPDAEATLAQ